MQAQLKTAAGRGKGTAQRRVVGARRGEHRSLMVRARVEAGGSLPPGVAHSGWLAWFLAWQLTAESPGAVPGRWGGCCRETAPPPTPPTPPLPLQETRAWPRTQLRPVP